MVNSTQTLRELAENLNLLIGAAVDETSFEDENYRRFLVEQFNCLCPQAALKWECCQAEQGQFDFEMADRIVDFGLSHGCAIRMNCLLWHRDIPEWVSDLKPNQEQAWDIVNEYFDKVLSHFRGRIDFCDVVNEAIGDDGPPRDVGWAPLLGEDWIAKAYQLAHKLAPETELFYCDYRPKATGKWKTITQMAQEFCDRKIPIHGLGVQLHSRLVPALSRRFATKLLTPLAGLGLKLHLPECGVWIPPNGWMADRQATIYGGMVGAGLAVGAEQIGFWWPTDWRTNSRIWLDFQGAPALPGLFDLNQQPKPAFNAVVRELQKGAALPVET